MGLAIPFILSGILIEKFLIFSKAVKEHLLKITRIGGIILFSMKYKIYTDGACSGNPGPGGWAAIIILDNKIKNVIFGKEKNTTNNQMELLAPIKAIQKFKTKSEISIFTDSTYVKNGITTWIKLWEKNGWKTASRKPVKNKNLWKKLKSFGN